MKNKRSHIKFNKKSIFIHRASWIIYKGPIPEGIFVLHKCDNPSCVNPEHLFLGTQQDNVNDMIQKNRQSFPKIRAGESHHFCKLKENDVLLIFKDTRTYNEILKDYPISKPQLCNIKKGRAWKKLLQESGYI